MLLNGDEISVRHLIEGLRDDKVTAASYTLTIGTIIGPDGEEMLDDDLQLEPQAMVVVVSAERIKTPKDTLGYIAPTVSLQNKGIFGLNTGIIDPGYDARVSNMLINFGSQSYTLKKGDSFIRATFHAVKPLAPDTNIRYRQYSTDDTKYLERHKRIARDLPDNFLNVKNLASQVAEEVVALTYEDEKRRYEKQRRDLDDRIAEQDRKVRELDERREEFMEESRLIRQEAVDATHKKNQDFLGRSAIWITVAITGVTLLVALMVFFLTPMASEITTQRVSENAASELRAEELPALEEEIERLEDRIDEMESGQP